MNNIQHFIAKAPGRKGKFLAPPRLHGEKRSAQYLNIPISQYRKRLGQAKSIVGGWLPEGKKQDGANLETTWRELGNNLEKTRR